MVTKEIIKNINELDVNIKDKVFSAKGRVGFLLSLRTIISFGIFVDTSQDHNKKLMSFNFGKEDVDMMDKQLRYIYDNISKKVFLTVLKRHEEIFYVKINHDTIDEQLSHFYDLNFVNNDIPDMLENPFGKSNVSGEISSMRSAIEYAYKNYLSNIKRAYSQKLIDFGEKHNIKLAVNVDKFTKKSFLERIMSINAKVIEIYHNGNEVIHLKDISISCSKYAGIGIYENTKHDITDDKLVNSLQADIDYVIDYVIKNNNIDYVFFTPFSTASNYNKLRKLSSLNKIIFEKVSKKIYEKDFKSNDLIKNVFTTKYSNNILETDVQSPKLSFKVMALQIFMKDQNYKDKTKLSYDKILELISDYKFLIPGGSILYGLNNPNVLSSLSNCFVVGGNDDSYGGIMLTEQEQIHIMKRRGGVGHDLSHIRHKGSKIDNVAKTSTGIVPFMERYSNSTREVAQDGRRGALMLSIDSDHRDALSFIKAKTDSTKITGANISLRMSDKAMKSSIREHEYASKMKGKYESINKQIINDSFLYQIANAAHSTAEPGILFWDRIIEESPADCYADKGFKTVSTNPCGEIPLSPYDACRLLAINMYSYVTNPFLPEATFNYELFIEHVGIAQRIMDDIIDLEIDKIDMILNKIIHDDDSLESKIIEYNLWKKIKDATLKGRRTGLGVTGVADMFAALGIKYGDVDKNIIVEDIFKEFAAAAYVSSIEMAKDRGSFPVFNRFKEANNPFINRIINVINNSPFHNKDVTVSDLNDYGRRNISLLTIAPTGSISILAGVSNGIENVFELSYWRRRKISGDEKDYKPEDIYVDNVGDSWVKYRVLHDKFREWSNITNATGVALEKLSDSEFKKLYNRSPYKGTVVRDINPIDKVKLQGMVQKYIDHAISNTCNLPKTATVADVIDIIITAWDHGCKGLTIYRDGSREGVLFNEEKPDLSKKKRPVKIDAYSDIEMINGRKTIILTGIIDKNPYEVFILDYEDFKKDVVSAQLLLNGEDDFDEVLLSKKSIVQIKRIDSGNYNLIIEAKRYRKPPLKKKRLRRGAFVLGEMPKYDREDYKGTHGQKPGLEKDSILINKNIVDYTIQDNGKFSTRIFSLMLRNNIAIDDIMSQIDKSDENITAMYKVMARVLKRRLNLTGSVSAKCPDCGGEMVEAGGCATCYNCGYSKCG